MKSNILFIHAESMDGRKLGCMGHPAMQRATPHLDRLARQGTMFTNAYTTCPVCNPSRASMWSGKYPHYYDCWNNYEGLHDHVPTFQDTFEAAGYRFGAIGPLDYQHGKHSIRDQAGSWTRSACIPRPTVRTPLPLVTEDPELSAGDRRHVHNAIDFLRESTTDERPFMLYLTTGLVHPAFTAAPADMAMIDADAIDLPPNLGGLEQTTHPVIRHMRQVKHCEHAFSEELVRQIRHVYFAMIARFDRLIGQVFETLDELGLAESTYVVFSSDHGEMAGEQNQVLKRSMFEPSSHIPLIIRGPGVRAGAIVETPVSLVDLYPTFLEMTGIDYADYAGQAAYPDTLDGESLLPQLTGQHKRRRDWAMCEYHGDRCCTGTFLLRRGDWTYMKYVGYQPQLFNLADDPWQVHDLATERPDIVAELEGILTGQFDCAAIDARAKAYDRQTFRRWRQEQLAAGTYRSTMAHIYSGYDRQCIEDMQPWTDADEARIEAWLAETG